MTYKVFRHSGRGYPDDENWKLVFESHMLKAAVDKYVSIRIGVRQGGVRLIGNSGILREYRAPRLRTRW